MKIVYSKRHRLHKTDDVLVEGRPLGSFEVPARAEVILEALRAAQIGPVIPPTEHGLAPILAVHDADYVAFVRDAYADSAAYFGEGGPVFTWTFAVRHAARKPQGFMGRKGYYAFGWGTPILEKTWEAAYWSAQCALTAADLIREGEPAAYALCRPPGHHAAQDLYGGYCYLNNAAIAARYLQHADPDGNSPKGRARVAILDIDYHHGNGTQIVFYTDPSILYSSLHAHPDQEYPYYWGGDDEQGQGPGLGTNRNWPLPRGTADDDYLATLEEALAAIRAFAPRFLVVSAGFDTLADDPEGGFCLTTDGLQQVGRRIAALEMPTLLVQEGGYLLDQLGAGARAFLQAFCLHNQ